MKTITQNGEFLRESNEVAEFKVKHQGWKYCTKSEWKKNVRDVNKKTITEIALEETEKHNQTKSKRAEKHKKLKGKQKPLYFS